MIFWVNQKESRGIGEGPDVVLAFRRIRGILLGTMNAEASTGFP